MRTIPGALVVVALVLAGCSRAGKDPADATDSATVAAAATPPVAPPAASFGVAGTGDAAYLVDAKSRAVYVLEGDDGRRCVGDCLATWLPVRGPTPVAAADDVQGAMISSISHDDGSMHITYNGMPLYYFARDTGPGMTYGQDVQDAWGHWYLVRPGGELMSPSQVAGPHGDPADGKP